MAERVGQSSIVDVKRLALEEAGLEIEISGGKILLGLKGLVKEGKYAGEVYGNLIFTSEAAPPRRFFRVIILGAVGDDEKIESGILQIGQRVKFVVIHDDENFIETECNSLLRCTVNYWKKW